MRMLQLLGFEWRYHTRRITFWAAALLYLVLGLFLPRSGYAAEGSYLNAPPVITQSVGLLSLLALFALTVFGAEAALRDSEHRMAPLVYATPVTRLQLLSARFLGALLASSAAFAFSLLGLLAGALLLARDPAQVGPVNLLDYGWAFLLLALPNMLLAGSLIFGVAAVTRSAAASYVAGVLAYVLYFIGAALSNSPMMAQSAPLTPAGLALAAVLDPFGLAALFEQVRHWTPEERKVRQLALVGNLLLNRALWIGVSLAVLAGTYRLFRLRLPQGAPRASVERAEATPPAMVYRPVLPSSGLRASWAALCSATRLELRAALRSWPFVALMVLWAGLAAMELAQGALRGELGTRNYPTTALMLELLRQPLMLFGALSLVYYSAEVVWRERLLQVSELVDATPSPSAVFFLSRAAALWLLLGIMVLIAVALAVGFQLASGWERLDLAPYLSLLPFALLPLGLFALAALFIQALSPHRHLGMLLNLVLAMAVLRGDSLGLEHPLLRYAGAPQVTYSAMAGYGPQLGSFLLFMAYWSAVAALLALLTAGLWRRGRVIGLRVRLSRLPGQWGRGGALAAGGCLVAITATGAVAFHGANVRHGWETAEEGLQWRVDYEQAYGRLQHLPQPQVVAVQAAVDLYPEEGRCEVSGSYRLRNTTQAALDRVWVNTHRRLRGDARLVLSGAEPGQHDARFGVWEFALRQPLQPGEELKLGFVLATQPPGIRAGDFDTSVVENGSYLTQSAAFPSVGFRLGYLLRDPEERRRRGLPALAGVPALEEAQATQHREPWIEFDTTVSTSGDQVAIAPGRLVRQWETNGRRYFHYASEGLMTPNFSYASGRYAQQRTTHRGVDLEAYFHPGHDDNVPRMLEAARRSLDLFSQRFGPYPHRTLRLVEVPSGWGFGAYAQPGTLFFTEDRNFLTDLRRPGAVDLVTKRVAHEVAHQWWGHRVDPPGVQGRLALVETLAKYSEMRVLEELYGRASGRELRAFELERYLSGRAELGEQEPSLHRVVDEASVYYAKGALVMAGVQALLGTEALDRALHRLVETRAAPQPATSLDLLRELQAEATPEQRRLIEEWITRRLLYDLRVREARCLPVKGGYRVSAVLDAGRTELREGREVAVPLDEPLEVALLSEDPERVFSEETVLHLARPQLRGPTQTLELEVAACPAFVAIDPFLTRVDRDRMDNVLPVRYRPR